MHSLKELSALRESGVISPVKTEHTKCANRDMSRELGEQKGKETRMASQRQGSFNLDPEP